MKDKLNNYVWTTVDVEKKLKMETEKETETVNVAREFKRILEQLHFREEEKAWYRTDTSGDSGKRGNYIFGGCNAPQELKRLFDFFNQRAKSCKQRGRISEDMITSLKYRLFELLPPHQNISELREAAVRKQKEEFCQLHDLLVQLRSLNIIEAALHQQEELSEQYAGILTKKQQRELEQVAEMVEKCCEYSVAQEEPDKPFRWLEEKRGRLDYAAVIDRRVEEYFADCFRDFYFVNQIWVKQERRKDRMWKELDSEMYLAVAEWNHKWSRSMTAAQEIRKLENEVSGTANIYSLCISAMKIALKEPFIPPKIKEKYTKDRWQEKCEELVDEILRHELEKNDRETYNYMLIRAFLELNDIHDKIAKEQQNYCLGHQEAEKEQEILPEPASECKLGTYYEAIFRQYK